MIRLKFRLPFKEWARAERQGDLPKLRAWLSQVEGPVAAAVAKDMANLAVYGLTRPDTPLADSTPDD